MQANPKPLSQAVSTPYHHPCPQTIYTSPFPPLHPDPTPPIPSTIDRTSAAYQSNYAAMQAALDRLRAELAKSRQGGGPKYVQRHIERGKLPPRERVEMLLDEHSY